MQTTSINAGTELCRGSVMAIKQGWAVVARASVELRVLIRFVIVSLAGADKEPSETTGASFDNVPNVESIDESLDTERTALVFRSATAPAGAGRGDRVLADRVWLPWEGEDMHYREDRHFNAEHYVGDPNSNILIAELACGLKGSSRGREQADYNLIQTVSSGAGNNPG